MYRINQIMDSNRDPGKGTLPLRIALDNINTVLHGGQYTPVTDAQYKLTSNEITNLERRIIHTLKEQVITPTLLPTINIGKGLTKHQFDKWTAPRAPRQTQDFTGRANTGVTKTETTIELIGMDYDYDISMIQRDAQNNPNSIVSFTESLDQGTYIELMAELIRFRERVIFRGDDLPTTYGWTNLGRTGLFNDSGLTTPPSLGAGADNDLTVAGDVLSAATTLANQLINKNFVPPFVLHLSPGVYQQSLKNKNSTTSASDYQLIMETGQFSEIKMNQYMLNATETNSTGAIACMKPIAMDEEAGGPVENFRIVESYSPGGYPLPPQGLEMPMKILWMGRAEIRRPDAIAYKGSQTINTLSA